MEVEEGGGHRGRPHGADRGGAADEVPHPEPPQPRATQRLERLRGEVGHGMDRFERPPPRPGAGHADRFLRPAHPPARPPPSPPPADPDGPATAGRGPRPANSPTSPTTTSVTATTITAISGVGSLQITRITRPRARTVHCRALRWIATKSWTGPPVTHPGFLRSPTLALTQALPAMSPPMAIRADTMRMIQIPHRRFAVTVSITADAAAGDCGGWSPAMYWLRPTPISTRISAMDRARSAVARSSARRRLRVSTMAPAKHNSVTIGSTTASLLRKLTSRWMRTRSLDWKSTKLSPLTAGTLSKTVIPLASSAFLAVSSTWLRSMVIFPPLVLTEPWVEPVSTATSCLWEARLTVTHSSSNLGDCTTLRVME